MPVLRVWVSRFFRQAEAQALLPVNVPHAVLARTEEVRLQMTTEYDLNLLAWLAQEMDKAASVARVRSTLAAMPASQLRDQLALLAKREHEAILSRVDLELKTYLGVPEELPSQSARRRS